MTRIAYTVQEAAERTGVNPRVIRAAIQRGDIIARYPTSRAVIEHEELQEWLKRLPTEAE